MIRFVFATLACLVLLGQTMAQSTADRQACQKQYSTSVSSCAKDLSFLAVSIRAGAQKACVSSAKLKRDVCMGEGSPDPVCQQSCLAAYTNTVAVCQVTYNPVDCGGSFICEQIVTQQRDSCISDAVTALNACTASCPLQ